METVQMMRKCVISGHETDYIVKEIAYTLEVVCWKILNSLVQEL